MAATAPISVILPSSPPSEGPHVIELPSMKPEEQAAILKELGKISGQQSAAEAVAQERHKALDARVRRLEEKVDASGAHDVSDLQKALETAQEESRKMKWWLMGILGSLIVSGLTAGGAYLVTR